MGTSSKVEHLTDIQETKERYLGAQPKKCWRIVQRLGQQTYILLISVRF